MKEVRDNIDFSHDELAELIWQEDLKFQRDISHFASVHPDYQTGPKFHDSDREWKLNDVFRKMDLAEKRRNALKLKWDARKVHLLTLQDLG